MRERCYSLGCIRNGKHYSSAEFGRPLDKWSLQLLQRYVDKSQEFYGEEGIPPVLANLYVIAAAEIAMDDIAESAARRWSALPIGVEETARNLIGLDAPVASFAATADEANALRAAVSLFGDDTAAWRHFADLACNERLGFKAAVARLAPT